MHSLNQGKIYRNKKDRYQYLEKKNSSKIIEGIESMENDTDWVLYENHKLVHTPPLTKTTGLVTPDLWTKGVFKINTWATINEATKENELKKIIEKINNNKNNQNSLDIYAFSITSQGKINYYQKINTVFYMNRMPKIQSWNGSRLWLKKNNGMHETTQREIKNKNKIEIKMESDEFDRLTILYQKVLNTYKETLKEYYEAKKAHNDDEIKIPHKGKIIQWSENGSKKQAYVNQLGVYRILDIPNLQDEIKKSLNYDKSFCPTTIIDVADKPSEYSEGAKYTSFYGACFEPGVYEKTGGAGKKFVNENGKVVFIKNNDNTMCNENKRTLSNDTYDKLPTVEGDTTCKYGNEKSDKMNSLYTKLTKLNNDLKHIATNGDGSEYKLSAEPNKGEIIKSNLGLKQLIENLSITINPKTGYRKIQHAIMNEEIVHLPIDGEPHYGENSNHDDKTKDNDINGLLNLQHQLNGKIKVINNLGNNISSLDTALITKKEQIKSINLRFFAWCLAGITIGAIGLHSVLKK